MFDFSRECANGKATITMRQEVRASVCGMLEYSSQRKHDIEPSAQNKRHLSRLVTSQARTPEKLQH